MATVKDTLPLDMTNPSTKVLPHSWAPTLMGMYGLLDDGELQLPSVLASIANVDWVT